MGNNSEQLYLLYSDAKRRPSSHARSWKINCCYFQPICAQLPFKPVLDRSLQRFHANSTSVTKQTCIINEAGGTNGAAAGAHGRFFRAKEKQTRGYALKIGTSLFNPSCQDRTNAPARCFQLEEQPEQH